MTFVEKFEEIKKKIGKPDISKLTEDFAVQINMTDEDCGGAFYIAYINGVLSIEPYDYRDNTASVTISSKDLADAVCGKLDIVAAVMSGRVSVFGNIEHLKAIMTLKKPAAKRTCKKTADKCTEAKTAEKPVAKRKCKTKTKEA